LPQKRWGLYDHYKLDREHPLMQWVNTRFCVPHSRNNAITRAQLEDAGAHVVVVSDEGDVHMAVSKDRFRFIFFQGHPEYDTNSLLKEYKRELVRFTGGERSDYPPFPVAYFNPQARAILDEYRERLESAPFPEALLMDRLFNIWRDTSKSIINNWLGHMYQITNVDRRKPFMEGINPNDPLGILKNK